MNLVVRVAALVLLVVALGVACGTPSPIDQAFEDLPTEMQNGNKLGSDDAPVRLIQFEDFQCVHCLTYTLTIEPFLVEEYVKGGLLQIEFRHFVVVGYESAMAAVGAYCAAEEDPMFEYANRLFARQGEDGFRDLFRLIMRADVI